MVAVWWQGIISEIIVKQDVLLKIKRNKGVIFIIDSSDTSLVPGMSTIPSDFSGLVFFSADWAGDACGAVRQVLNALEGVSFIEVAESESTDALFNRFNIEAVPTVLSLQSGREVGRVVGFEAKAITELANQKPSVAPIEAPKTEQKEPDYQALVNTAPLMLFIKGTPEAPQCGFTGQLIRLLAQHGLNHPQHYRTFNILNDPVVRQGLKEYSQWPTYPQIYWHGELLGGLDILKEMFATGQMDPIINELAQ